MESTTVKATGPNTITPYATTDLNTATTITVATVKTTASAINLAVINYVTDPRPDDEVLFALTSGKAGVLFVAVYIIVVMMM